MLLWFNDVTERNAVSDLAYLRKGYRKDDIKCIVGDYFTRFSMRTCVEVLN